MVKSLLKKSGILAGAFFSSSAFATCDKPKTTKEVIGAFPNIDIINEACKRPIKDMEERYQKKFQR